MGATDEIPGSPGDGDDLEESAWADLLRGAFVPKPDAPVREGDGLASLLSQEASHLAPGEVSEDPEARGLLADLGAALVEAEGRSLSPVLRARALAAWAKTESERPLLTATPPPRRWSRHAVAASVLALVGVGLLLGGPAEAAPTLRIEGVIRSTEGSGGASVRWEPGRAAAAGDTFRAAPGESLALSLEGGGRVLLPADSTATVVPGPDGAGMLRLDAGAAVVAPRERPVLLALEPIHRVLEVGRGQARVEVRGPTRPADGVRIVLDADGAAVLSAAPGGEPARLGAATASTWPEGEVSAASGPLADALPAAPRDRGAGAQADADRFPVPARLWRVVAGRVARLGGTARWSAAAGEVRVGWTPVASLGEARVLRVRVRGPRGLGVRLEGTPVRGVLQESGASHVDLVLPEGTSLPGGETVLAFVPPDASASDEVRFEGVDLRRTPAVSPGASAAGGER